MSAFKVLVTPLAVFWGWLETRKASGWLSVIGILFAAAAWFWQGKNLNECRANIEEIRTQAAESELARERRQRAADDAIRQIQETGKDDIQRIRSTQDDCAGVSNPDADLLRNKADQLHD